MTGHDRPARMLRGCFIALLVTLVAVAGCTRAPAGSVVPSSSSAVTTRLVGTVLAGPACPVVTEPPQSRCADRPVANAQVLVLDRQGNQVARATSGTDGSFAIDLPPGRYRLVPQPVDDVMGTAPPQDVTLDDATARVTLTYDTGIR